MKFVHQNKKIELKLPFRTLQWEKTSIRKITETWIFYRIPDKSYDNPKIKYLTIYTSDLNLLTQSPQNNKGSRDGEKLSRQNSTTEIFFSQTQSVISQPMITQPVEQQSTRLTSFIKLEHWNRFYS